MKAREVLEKRKKSAEQEWEKRHSAALLKLPELGSIEREMASFGAEAVRLVACGKNADVEIKKLAEKSLEIQQKRKNLLLSSGLPEDYLDIRYHCEKCGDTGSHDGFYCECYKKLVTETARRELASVELLDASSFDNFRTDYYPLEEDPQMGVSPREHMEAVLKMCREFASDFPNAGGGLFFFGKTGLGKTHLSLAIADEVTKRGFNVFYSSAQNMLNRLEKEHFSREKSETDTLEELFAADLLIIDDLGAEFSTSFTVSQIYNIINTRMIDGKPTIISTNLTMDEIEDKYSQRVTSRIIGSITPVVFFGNDIRQIKAGEY